MNLFYCKWILFAILLQCSFVLSVITNCKEHTNSDKTYCKYCDNGYYMNWNQKICNQISKASHSFCIQTDYLSNCIRCQGNYVIISDKKSCAPVTEDLIGCEVVRADSICLRPKLEYVLRTLESGVVKIRYSSGSRCEIENIALICIQCHSGYFLDNNGYCIQSPMTIINLFYSYFLGTSLQSRVTTLAPGNYGVFPVIKYCYTYVTRSEDDFYGNCIACYSGMVPTEITTGKNSCLISPGDYCKTAMQGASSVICTECELNDYFYLVTQGSYQACVARNNHLFDNCLTRNSNSDGCIACATLGFNSSGQCLIEQRYSQVGRGGTSVLNWCLTIEDLSNCQECISGYYLLFSTSPKVCYALPTNCVKSNSSGCSQCSPIYYRSGGGCALITNTSNCVESIGITDACTRCLNLYFLSTGVCTAITSFSNCYYSDGKNPDCKICNNLFYPSANNCLQLTTGSCLYSDGKFDKCIQCKKYTTLDAAGKCIGDISIPDQFTCLSLNGFYWDSVSPNCKPYTFQNFLYCLIFDSSSNKCIKCLPTHYLDPAIPTQSSCIPIPASPVATPNTNCLGDGINPICIYCILANFYSSSGACVSGTSVNNHFSVLPTYCIYQGLPGYTDQASVAPSQCKTNLTIIRHCVRFQNFSTQICQICDNLYQLEPFTTASINTCIPIDNAGCQYSDGTTRDCLLCSQGYSRTNTGKAYYYCIKDPIPHCLDQSESICTKCDNLYYLNTIAGNCFPISNPNCLYSDQVHDTCSICQANSNFVDSKYTNFCGFPFCSVSDTSISSNGCITCQLGYYLNSSGECRPVPQNTANVASCLIQTSMTICSLCKPDYYLYTFNSGEVICYPIANVINNCKYGDGSSTIRCKICDPPYFLSSRGTCLKVSNCFNFDSSTNTCTKCNPGYGLTSDQLTCLSILNCSTTDGIQCIACSSASGYYLFRANDGTTSCSLIPNCSVSADGIIFECAICKVNFTLSATKQCQQTPTISNCQTYSAVGTCSLCKQGFYLSSNTCSINSQLLTITIGITYPTPPAVTPPPSSIQIFVALNTILCRVKGTLTTDQCLIDNYDPNGIFNTLSPNCYIFNYLSANTFVCAYCKRGYYFDSLGNCIAYALTAYDPAATTNIKLANCNLLYYKLGLTTAGYNQCVKCKSLFFYNTASSVCSAITASACLFSNGIVDQCANCQTKGYIYKQAAASSTSYSCIKYTKQSSLKRGCTMYSSTEVCTQCVANHYLGGNGECIPRKLYDNCAQYSKTSEECIKCLPFYVLVTNDQNHPFASTYCRLVTPTEHVINCQAYSFNSIQNKYLCSECYSSGQYGDLIEYYLDTIANECVNAQQYLCSSFGVFPACLIKSIQNCATYDSNTSTRSLCIACQTGFYLSLNTCLPQIFDSNCVKYSTISLGCLFCDYDYTVDSATKKCVLNSNPRGYCIKKTTGCDTCYEGFKVDSTNPKCVRDQFPNCSAYSTSSSGEIKCTACSPLADYFHSNYEQCLPMISLQNIDKCLEYFPDSHMEYYWCKKCDTVTVGTNTYQLEIDESYRCSYDLPDKSFVTDSLPDVEVKETFSKILSGRFMIITVVIFIIFNKM